MLCFAGLYYAATKDAAKAEVLAILETLVDGGAMVNARSGTGESGLGMAATLGHVATVRFLINAGADLEITFNSDGAAALYSAAREGHVDVVQVGLLDWFDKVRHRRPQPDHSCALDVPVIIHLIIHPVLHRCAQPQRRSCSMPAPTLKPVLRPTRG